MKYGIDVSAAQGVIDWAAVKASGLVDFAIVQCSQGNAEVNGISRDPYFDRNVAGCVANGIPWGAYQFVYPLPTIAGAAFKDRDPVAQAQLHFTSRGDVRADLPDACDAEWPYPQDWAHWGCSANQIADWLARYLEKYESLSGRRMAFYTFASWWQAIGGQRLAELAARPLWCAQPVPRSLRPIDGIEPRPWQPFAGWTLWQYTGASPSFYERIPGIAGDVDGDAMTDAAFAALTTGTASLGRG